MLPKSAIAVPSSEAALPTKTLMFVMSAGCAVWVGRYDQKSAPMRQSPKVVGLTKELSHEY